MGGYVGRGVINKSPNSYSSGEVDTLLGDKADTTYVDSAVASAAKYAIGKSSFLKGDFALDNTITQAGMSTFTYTGNGGSLPINNGTNLKDSWVDYTGISTWSAGTYNLDDEVTIIDSSSRVLRCVCLQNGVTSDPNSLLTMTDATFSDWKIESSTYGGSVWIKNRGAGNNNIIGDTTRGASNYVYTSANSAEFSYASSMTFESTGFTLNATTGDLNGNGNTYVSWTNQTINVTSGLTNHGKPYIVEFNPVTGYCQVKYKGSGVTGHAIEHMLGRKLGFSLIKNLDAANLWDTQFEGYRLSISQTAADYGNLYHTFTENAVVLDSASINWNASGEEHILYGWASSYIDNDGAVQGNYETGTYQGTGATGSKIPVRKKPAYILGKRIDGTGNWFIKDVVRDGDHTLYANLAIAEEASSLNVTFNPDDFTINITHSDMNASGGNYFYLIVYDNDNGTGKSNYTKASETSEITVTDGVVSYTNGVDVDGVDSSIENQGSVTLTGIAWDIG